MRTIIDLPDAQAKALKACCKREPVSRAEAVRRAVEGLVNSPAARRAEWGEAIRAAFGIWKDRGIDGLDYQRQLRAEWDCETAGETGETGGCQQQVTTS